MKAKNSSSRVPTQRRSIERVESILVAAEACIREIGFSELKMKDISGRAEVSPSSVYQYFPDKKAILVALTRRYTTQILEAVSSELGEINTIDDLDEFLGAYIENYYDFLKKKPVVKSIIANLAIDPSLKSEENKLNVARARVLSGALKAKTPKNKLAQFADTCYWAQHNIHASVCLALQLNKKQGHVMLDMTRQAIINQFDPLLDS